MELLDSDLDLQPDGLTVSKLEAKIALKNEYSKAKKIYGHARLVTVIITVLTCITLAVASSNGVEVGFVEIGLLLVYMAAIFVPIEYSKYSFSLISLLYLINLSLAFVSYSNGLLLLIIIVRLGILYFIVKGAYSGFKVEDIFRKMKTLDMQNLRSQ